MEVHVPAIMPNSYGQHKKGHNGLAIRPSTISCGVPKKILQ